MRQGGDGKSQIVHLMEFGIAGCRFTARILRPGCEQKQPSVAT